MTLVNERWPRDLCPESCVFGRTRNDVRQVSVRTRKPTIIRQGRPLYRAECTWSLPNTRRLAKLRYWLEELDGYAGSVQLWDFANPYPFGLELATGSDGLGEVRTSWVNSSVTSLWNFGGFPSHWAADSFVLTQNAESVGALTIELTGLEPNKQIAIQGQYVQIDRRLYLVASAGISNASGIGNITLQSGLLKAKPAGSLVRLAEAGCEMQLADQNIDTRSQAGSGRTIVTATFIESVEDIT